MKLNEIMNPNEKLPGLRTLNDWVRMTVHAALKDELNLQKAMSAHDDGEAAISFLIKKANEVFAPRELVYKIAQQAMQQVKYSVD